MTDETETEGTDNTETPAEAQSESSVATEAPATEGAEEQQASEGSVVTESPAETAEGETAAQEGAPESYGDFNVPEGFEGLDETLLEQAVPLFKEANMGQERAQKFIDLYASTLQGQTESQVTAFNDVNNTNRKACEDHAEFGGDNLKESQVFAARAIDTIMGDDAQGFREMLDATGLGNHPHMFVLLTKVGKSISEDGIVDGGAPGTKVSVAEGMYGEDGTGRDAGESGN